MIGAFSTPTQVERREEARRAGRNGKEREETAATHRRGIQTRDGKMRPIKHLGFGSSICEREAHFFLLDFARLCWLS